MKLKKKTQKLSHTKMMSGEPCSYSQPCSWEAGLMIFLTLIWSSQGQFFTDALWARCPGPGGALLSAVVSVVFCVWHCRRIDLRYMWRKAKKIQSENKQFIQQCSTCPVSYTPDLSLFSQLIQWLFYTCSWWKNKRRFFCRQFSLEK